MDTDDLMKKARQGLLRDFKFKFGSLEVETNGSVEDNTAALASIGAIPRDAWIEASKRLGSQPSEVATTPLSQAITDHVADLTRRRLAQDTITESKHSLRLLLGISGDIALGKVQAPQIRAFWDAVRWWPANATVKPEYRGLSVLEIVERGKAENVPDPSVHTYNKHQQRLGVFFNGLVESGTLSRSPLKGLGPEIDTSMEMETGRPFTDFELGQIFDPLRFLPWAETPHRWWGSMLGLYTGARVNEVAQLYVADVKEVNGVRGVFFWKGRRNQKIKTKSSIRFVPLAPPLLDAGFMDFVKDAEQSGHPRLFPHLPAGTKADGTPNGLGYGRQLSRQFAKYVHDFGIEKGVAFHSFRHTLATALTEADVDVSIIAKLTGHAKKMDVPVLETHYIHIADTKTLPERVAALARFEPCVVLPRYVRGQFSESLAHSDDLHP